MELMNSRQSWAKHEKPAKCLSASNQVIRSI